MGRDVNESLLVLRDVHKRFGSVAALRGVSVEIRPGRILGIVGGSGSGKSTLANVLLGLERPDAGAALYRNVEVHRLKNQARRDFRASVQMVFQDPFGSLNPRMTAAATVEEPLTIQRRGSPADRRAVALAALAASGLLPPETFRTSFPHALSGGQRQRVSIARAIVLAPAVLVADEPASMLDVSIRNGVMRLFRRFADEQGMAIVLITHDLSLLIPWCDDVAVMHDGVIVETGVPRQIAESPSAPYTRSLIAAIPQIRM